MNPNPHIITFKEFKSKLNDLVSQFESNFSHYKSKGYDEAALRNDVLNPFWRALGWDMENLQGLPQQIREVEIESRVNIAGRKKKADYLFRTDGINRFVCEAKKPLEEISRFAFQVQRYAFNMQLYTAVLSNFEELYIYVVGGRPDAKIPFEPVVKYSFRQYPLLAEKLWNLFSREKVSAGSLDQFISELPKRPIKGKARQGWLIQPDRIRKVDKEFLFYLEESRRELAKNIVQHNPGRVWDENNLNEAVQRILDRIIFIRICEDRDIDVNGTLESIVKNWKEAQIRQPFYPLLVRLFGILDKGSKRAFNGGLFAPHFSEQLELSDDFLLDFIDELSGEESPYLFNIIPVEILGSIYERFIRKRIKIVPSGNVKITDKPDAGKAEGVYYTPQYIVDFIVDRAVGPLVKDKTPEEVSRLRILDPACGSGSFLIRVFDRLCEYYKEWLLKNPRKQRPDWCWFNSDQNLHLTTGLKRQIVLDNIFGVDIDPQAVEVSQFSLYLKILEGETRLTLAAEYPLFKGESILPDLKNNIRMGNSLIESDYFDLFSNGDELRRIRPLDWKAAFPEVFKGGGFDVVLGNPPWGQKAVNFTAQEKEYLRLHYEAGQGILDLFKLFTERAIKLVKPHGSWAMILPDIILLKNYPETRKMILEQTLIEWIAYAGMPFEKVNLDSVVLVCTKNVGHAKSRHKVKIIMDIPAVRKREISPDREILQSIFYNLKGYKLNIHLNKESLDLLNKLNGRPKLDEFLEAHEGIHSGNIRAKLFLPKKRNRFCRKMIFGRDEIRRYQLVWGGKWINYNPEIIDEKAGEYANLGDESYFTAPKIFVRRTGDYVMAVPDFNEYFASNNLFVLLKKGPSTEAADTAPSLCYFTGLLNSNLMTWYFRTIQPRVGKLFAELKINQIHDFPIPSADFSNPKVLAEHDRLAALVKRIMDLRADYKQAISELDKRTLEGAIQGCEHSLNGLVYELCDLTKEEISLVERESIVNDSTTRERKKHPKPSSNPSFFL